MNLKQFLWSRCVLLPSMVLLTCIFPVRINAAPHEIEGKIEEVKDLTQTIKDNKVKYVFTGMDVKYIGLIGLQNGKEYKYYKYMIVKDSTKLEGISYDELKVGVYVRSRSRGEPPGMYFGPWETLSESKKNEVRASRFGCCEYALYVDTIHTPQNITGNVTNVEKISATELVVTVLEDKDSKREFKYLIVSGSGFTAIKDGSFSDIKKDINITISQANINMPSKGIYAYCAILHGADLYAPNVTINPPPTGIIRENKPEISSFINCGFTHSTVYTLTGRKIATFETGDLSTIKTFAKNLNSKQMLLVKTKNKNGTAIKWIVPE